MTAEIEVDHSIETYTRKEFERKFQVCSNCAYYRRKETRTWSYATGERKLKSAVEQFFCRRNPPLINSQGTTVWPQPHWNDWCGEHLLAEGFESPEPLQPPPRQIGF